MINSIDIIKYTSLSDLRKQIAYDVITNNSSIGTSSFDISDTIINLILQLQKQSSLFNGRGYIKLIEHSNMDRHKIIEAIKTLLMRFGDFKSFIQINNIDDNSLLDAITNSKLIKLDNGACLFREGDEAKGVVYCVLKGKVSLRKRHFINKNSNDSIYFQNKKKQQEKESNIEIKQTKINKEHNNNNNNNDSISPNNNIMKFKRPSVQYLNSKEIKRSLRNMLTSINRKNIRNIGTTIIKKEYIDVTLLTRTEGYCIIDTYQMDDHFHHHCMISVYCLDDTYFLQLQGSSIKSALSKNISKTEHQKRQYLRTHFLPLHEITSVQFDIFYSFITVKYFAIPNQFVFLQNSDINTITIIYNGQFALTSNGKRIIKLNNKVILGLESIFTNDYSNNKTFPKYKYSLISEYSGEVGMVMQIKREFIPEFLIDAIKKKFQYYYETFTLTIDELLTQKIKVEKARSGTNVNKSIFYSMNENQKCETAIDIYFKLAVSDLEYDNKVVTPLKAVSVSHRKQILKDFSMRKRVHKKNKDLYTKSHSGNISSGLIEGNVFYHNIRNNYMNRENKSYFSVAPQLRKDLYHKQHCRSSINKSISKDYSLNDNNHYNEHKQSHSYYLNRSNSYGIMSATHTKMKEKLRNNFSLFPVKKIIFDCKASPKVSYNTGNFNLPFVSKIMNDEAKEN